ncbi:hypothetical protein Aglo02_42670 [Actinokineospora globicatena]|nr:hypothetical protein Aglo02_42670 [Actinokineospora globicatena]
MGHEAIAAKAGFTATTFNNHYPARKGGKRRYLEDLMSYLVCDAPRTTHTILGQKITEAFIESKGDPRRAIREVCDWDFRQVLLDDSTAIRFFLAGTGRNHLGAMKAIRDEYSDINRLGRQAYEATLAHWGVALRKPFTLDSFATIMTALVEGLVLRKLLDPDAVSDNLFSDAALAIAASVIDIDQQHEHIDDVMEPLAEQVMHDFRLGQLEAMPENPRTACVDAARQEFGQRGFHATSMAHIATVAGVKMELLKRLFPSKAHVVLGALRPVFDDLRSHTGDDIKIGVGNTATVKRFIRRLAEHAVTERVMFEALLVAIADSATMDLASPRHIKNEINFPTLIAPIIRTGQALGEFVPGLDAGEIAVTITNLTLLQVSTAASRSPEEIAETVSALLLDGLTARSTG